MKIVDINGVEYKDGDLVNVYYTSDNGEHIHDAVYKVARGVLGGMELRYVDLLWSSYGHNQYPSSTVLCEGYGSLDYIPSCEAGVEVIKLVIPDKTEYNCLYKHSWKGTDRSEYFEILGRGGI